MDDTQRPQSGKYETGESIGRDDFRRLRAFAFVAFFALTVVVLWHTRPQADLAQHNVPQANTQLPAAANELSAPRAGGAVAEPNAPGPDPDAIAPHPRPDPLLITALKNARTATREARDDASAAQAPRLAAPRFARAVEIQERAEAMRKQGDLAGARRSFAESRDLFAQAAREARDLAFLDTLKDRKAAPE